MNYPFLLHLRAKGKHMHERTEWPKNSIRGCAMWPLLMIWKQMLLVGRCPSGRRRRDKQTGTLTKTWNISVGIFGISNLNWIELNIWIAMPLWWISSTKFPAFSLVQCSNHKNQNTGKNICQCEWQDCFQNQRYSWLFGFLSWHSWIEERLLC